MRRRRRDIQYQGRGPCGLSSLHIPLFSGLRTPSLCPMRLITSELPIIIDTREQRPYTYPGATRATLATGDYSVEGYESRITVERKSFVDLLGCIGRSRARFKRELERLSAFDYAAIVIEASLDDILMGHELSKVAPASTVNSLIKWSIKYGVYIYFAGDRDNGEAITYRILQHFVKWVDGEQTEGKQISLFERMIRYYRREIVRLRTIVSGRRTTGAR